MSASGTYLLPLQEEGFSCPNSSSPQDPAVSHHLAPSWTAPRKHPAFSHGKWCSPPPCISAQSWHQRTEQTRTLQRRSTKHGGLTNQNGPPRPHSTQYKHIGGVSFHQCAHCPYSCFIHLFKCNYPGSLGTHSVHYMKHLLTHSSDTEVIALFGSKFSKLTHDMSALCLGKDAK